MNLTHEFRVISREDIELEGVGTVVDEVEWEFVFTPDDPEYAEYTHTETGVTFLDEDAPETALLANEATDEKIKEWVIEQEGGQDFITNLDSTSRNLINERIVEDHSSSEVELVSPDNTGVTTTVTMFGNFIVTEMKFDNNATLLFNGPKVVNGVEVKPGEWFQADVIIFASDGEFNVESAVGKMYKTTNKNNPPKLLMALPSTFNSENESTLVLIKKVGPDQQYQYDSSRRLCNAGDVVSVGSSKSETGFYVCQGSVQAAGETVESGEFKTVSKGTVLDITAKSDNTNIVVIEEIQPYVFLKTTATPKSLKDREI